MIRSMANAEIRIFSNISLHIVLQNSLPNSNRNHHDLLYSSKEK